MRKEEYSSLLVGDYQTYYDSFWNANERKAFHREDYIDNLSEVLLQMCGTGRTLDIGCGRGELVKKLISKGIEAYGIDISKKIVDYNKNLFTDFFAEGDIRSLPYPNESFEIVTCNHVIDYLREEDILQAIKEMYRVSKRYIYCVVTNIKSDDNHLTLKHRDWWEQQFFQAGFRKHSLTLKYFPYETMEQDQGSFTMVLEKIPAEVLELYPHEKLLEERTLHMDMLRESGRRSDAHVQRYTAALPYVRPNDVVLDVACGLGYGSALIWDGSMASKVIGVDITSYSVNYAEANYKLNRPGLEFYEDDAQSLSFLEENSIDLIISMETVEHLIEPEVFFSRAQRLLKPGGRIMLSIPNEWVDENGEDPNPYHYHVFNLEKITNLVSEYFDIEKRFGEIAGGGMKLPDSKRRWFEFHDGITNEEAEWWIVLAMKSPFAREADYKETVHWSNADYSLNHPYNYRDVYHFPEIQHALVSIGIRASSVDLKVKLAKEAMQKSSSDSADHGAALCVLGYQILSSQDKKHDEINMLIASLKDYVAHPSQTSMQMRWKVSNAYLLAQIFMMLGLKEKAVYYYEKCAELDYLEYSPTIGTKIIGSYVNLGMIYLIDNEVKIARHYWSKAMHEVSKIFSVPWNSWWIDDKEPLTFALKEASQILDLASQAAFALWTTSQGKNVRSNTWSEINNFLTQKQMNWYSKKVNQLEDDVSSSTKWTMELQKSKFWMETKYQEMKLEIDKVYDSFSELKAWNEQVFEGKQWLESKVNELEGILKEKENILMDTLKWNEELQSGKQWLETKVEELEQIISKQNETISKLRGRRRF